MAAEVQAARHDKRLSPQEVASLGRAGRRLVEDAASKALARIEKRRKSGSKETDLVLSAKSASIISLRLIEIAPRSIQ